MLKNNDSSRVGTPACLLFLNVSTVLMPVTKKKKTRKKLATKFVFADVRYAETF
jgi:hypothetical protein